MAVTCAVRDSTILLNVPHWRLSYTGKTLIKKKNYSPSVEIETVSCKYSSIMIVCENLICIFGKFRLPKSKVWKYFNTHRDEGEIYQDRRGCFKKKLRPEFFHFLVLGSADPNFWKSRIKIKLGSKSFTFILSADRLMPSTNEIKARTIFLG